MQQDTALKEGEACLAIQVQGGREAKKRSKVDGSASR
jgi:hypothetical protein